MKHMILVSAIALSTAVLFAADKNPKREKIRKAILEQYDANGNGTLDGDERALILKTYDANGNGKLDRGERLALVKAAANKQTPQARADDEGDPKDDEASKWNTRGFKQANTMGGGKAEISKSGELRVFLLMGQSNMTGSGKARELKSPYNEKHDRIRIWANGRWEYFVPRVKFGPGVAMAHELADLWPDDTIGIIKVAVGGTGIHGFVKDWSKAKADRTNDGKKGPLYQDLMNAVAEAKKISEPVFSGFVWKQGGGDKGKKDIANNYYDTFAQLVSDLRKDLNTPEMPVFVFNALGDEELDKRDTEAFSSKWKYLMPILKAKNRAGRDIPNAVTVIHGTDLPKVDALHYNTEGQLTLGKMASSAVKTFYDPRK